MTTIPVEFADALMRRYISDGPLYCELVPSDGDRPRHTGGCPRRVVGAKWEGGFLDLVCDKHATNAEGRGALVLRPS